MRIIVGYTDTPAGKDALALGVRLARACEAAIDIVLVLANEERATLVPQDAGYERLLHSRAQGWLAKAAAKVPSDVSAETHVVYAESFAQGLLDTSKQVEGSIIVIGGASAGLRGRFTLGSVATALLHSAVVPVALAPKGIRKLELDGVGRVTVAVGTRAGSEELLDAGILVSRLTHAPLRLVSLVSLDIPGDAPAAERQKAQDHAASVLEYAAQHLPEAVSSEAVVATGKKIESAVRDIVWDPSELVLVGSSRLAQKGQLFLGSTAAKMLRELPVPMVVVPRDSVLTIGE